MLRVDTKTVGRDVGRLVQAVSLMIVVSIIIAAINQEFYTIPALVASAAVMAGIGTGLARRYRDATPRRSGTRWSPRRPRGCRRHSWRISVPVDRLDEQVDPFPVWANTPPMDSTTAVFLHPLDAVFESVSGFTGTGLTMAAVEEELPRARHCWRVWGCSRVQRRGLR